MLTTRLVSTFHQAAQHRAMSAVTSALDHLKFTGNLGVNTTRICEHPSAKGAAPRRRCALTRTPTVASVALQGTGGSADPALASVQNADVLSRFTGDYRVK